MRLIDLPRTSSFRLALVFLALFGIASSVLLGFLYLRTEQFLILHVDSWLNREARGAQQAQLAEIIRDFNAHAATNPEIDHALVLYDGHDQRLAGDPLPMPTPIPAFDKPFDYQR